MYTFTKLVTKDVANKQITAFTENYKNMSPQQADTIRNALPTEPTFGYVMYSPSQLTDDEIIYAMRYNDSKDTNFMLFTIWHQLTFVFLDLHANQIMCWGTNENVQDGLEGIQELLNNAIHKKLQNQNEQLKKVAEQKRVCEQKRVDEQNKQKRIDNYDDRMEYWDKEYMENKHL